ncbi:MAG: AI-2E family transporter, partial [Chloroflexi bacterium]
MNDERHAKEASSPQKGKGPRLVSLLNQGIQVLRKPPQGTTARGVGPSGDTQTSTEEVVVAPVQTDELLVNLARWVRRLIIPLAVLAWSGVALLILWTAGHVTKTLLLLVIAALFAYALSPLVTLLARVLPRFLAVLVVYLLVLLAVGALLYLIISTAIVQVTSLSSYLGFL